MRVLVTIHSLRRGGAERVAIDLAHGLQACGHSILLAPLLSTNEYTQDVEGLEVTPLFAAAEYRWPSCVPVMARMLRQRSEKFRPDVIQIHTPTAAIVTAWAGVEVPVQHVIHGYGAITRPPSIKAFLVRQADRWACRRTNAKITVVAESMRQLTAKHFGNPKSEIDYVPNGVEVDKFAFVNRPPPLNPKILVVGTLAAVKRPDLAIAAMPAMLMHFPDTQLLIAGDGPLRESLRSQIHLLGLAEKVHLLGRRDDIPALMTEANLLWHLSASEGLPLAVAEAMATGLPVIGHDVRGVRDLIVDGESGLLIPYEDTDTLVHRSVEILSAPSLYSTISRQARQRVVQLFSKQRMLAGHEAVLERLVLGDRVRASRGGAGITAK